MTKAMNDEERAETRQRLRDARQALRAFLGAVRAEPGLSAEVTQAAATAVERLEAAEEAELRWIEESDYARGRLADMQRELGQMQKLLAELYGTLEQEEWPAGA